MDSPVPTKKARLSELRPSESFKSEYKREFAGDKIKVGFNHFQDLNFFRNQPKERVIFIVICAILTTLLGKLERLQLSITTSHQMRREVFARSSIDRRGCRRNCRAQYDNPAIEKRRV